MINPSKTLPIPLLGESGLSYMICFHVIPAGVFALATAWEKNRISRAIACSSSSRMMIPLPWKLIIECAQDETLERLTSRALLGESLVEESLNREGFFTIRGVKHGAEG